MKILVDTNILLDVLLEREGLVDESQAQQKGFPPLSHPRPHTERVSLCGGAGVAT
ncbi:MAG: hypothetical protein WD490_07005 [Opitutales bacterium]